MVGAEARAVMVRFSFVGGEAIPARVAPDGWLPEAHGDLALLELDRDAPPSAQSARLLPPRAVAGHACTAYGYPIGHDDGVLSELVVTGQTPGRLQLRAQVAHGHQIVRGFSGTGLLDTETGAVVGLVVTRDLGRNVLGGFAIPLQAVKAAFPQLSPWLGWRVGTDPLLHQHWRPRAGGVYQDTTPGWYFTGRDALLRELAEWLKREEPDGAIRVLTGGAGTGKSAVLAWLCALSDPQLRAEIAAARPATVANAATVPAAGRVSAAVWARDLDTNGAADALASALSIPVPADAAAADVLSALQRLEASERNGLVIVMDALDEAREPRQIVRTLLIPLARDLRVKVLTGTRSGRDNELLTAFGDTAAVYRLDDPAWFERQDLADYAATCLRADFDPEVHSGYRTDPVACRQVSQAIASAAGKNFLVAGLAARARANEPVIDVSAPGWRDRPRFPADVGQAFDDYLSRFGHNENRARDLLRAVAYAEGPGLPPGPQWANMASALAAPRHYVTADLAWLLGSAASYLIESGKEHDQPVYRIFHQALAEHLRPEAMETRAQQQLVKVLLQGIPVTAQGRREWLATTPYVRTHLAAHARKGRVLDELVNDPGFLLAADPGRLLPALATVTDPEARKSASAFESVHYLLPGWPAGRAAAQLDLAARVHGATALINAISELPYQRPWTISWGHWSRPDRNVVLGRHPEEVQAVVITAADGDPVAVSGGGDGMVRVWDLATGTARGAPQSGHTGPVKALAVGEVDGTPVAVSGSSDGTIRMWDLRTGSARDRHLIGHGSGVTAIRLAQIDGTPVGISSDSDGTIRISDLRTGTPRGGPLTGHAGAVKALTVCEVAGSPIVVSGGSDGTVRVWDLRTGTERGEPLAAHSSDVGGLPVEQVARMPELVAMAGVTALAAGEVDGCPVAVSGGGDGLVRIWDLRTGREHGEPLIGHTYDVSAVAVGEVDGAPVAVTSDGVDGKIYLWDLRAGIVRGEPLTARWGDVAALAVGEVDGAPVAVSSGGLKATVHVWDLRAWSPLGKPLTGHSRPVKALAVGEVDGVPVAVSGSSDGTVRMWDLRAVATGEPTPGNSGIRAISAAVGDVDGIPVGVSGGSDGMIRVWDLRTGAPRGEPLHGHEASVYAVAAGKVDGIPVAVSGGSDGTVRVWDLRTGRPRGKPLTGHRAWVLAVAVGDVDGTPVAVSGGWDGSVRVWDLRAGTARGAPLSGGGGGGVGAVAVDEVDGTPVAVSGSGDGKVQMWDLRTGTAYGKALPVHTAPVGAVSSSEVDGDPVAVSGGYDGAVRVWDLRAGGAHTEILPGHTRSVRAVALEKAHGLLIAASGDDNGAISVCALDRGQSVAASITVHAQVEAIASCGAAGWLTVTKDGSLFLWRLALEPWRAADTTQANPEPANVTALRAIRVLGEAERAARSLTDDRWRAPELARIAEALAASDPDQAARLFTTAEQAAESITSEEWKALTLAEVAGALAASDPERAVGLAQSITDKGPKVSALVAVAKVLAVLDPDRATELITNAERLAQSITTDKKKASALAEVTETLAMSDPNRAAELAQSITSGHSKVSALTKVANALAVSDPGWTAELIILAECVARSIPDEEERARAVTKIAKALPPSNLDRAIRLAQSISYDFWHDWALTGIVEALATSHPDRALDVAQSITEQWRSPALAGIAGVLAASDPNRAICLAQSITSEIWRARALTQIAKAWLQGQ